MQELMAEVVVCVRLVCAVFQFAKVCTIITHCILYIADLMILQAKCIKVTITIYFILCDLSISLSNLFA